MYFQCPDIPLKIHALFGIKQMIYRHQQHPNEEIINHLVNWIIQSLTYETNNLLWENLCEVVSLITKNWPDYNYEPLYKLANNLLHSPNQQAVGLCLWGKAFPYEREGISENTLNLIKELFIVATPFLLNSNQIIRQSAYGLIDVLIFQLGGQIDIESNEEFLPILNNVKITIIQYADLIFKSEEYNSELHEFIISFSDIFDVEIPFFSDSMPIIDTAINAISNPSIPVNVRICIHSLINDGFKLYPFTKDLLYILLHHTLQLTLAACHENRFDDGYTFSEKLFSKIVESDESVFDFFSENIHMLSQSEDICDHQVALLLIKSSIEVMNIESSKFYLNLSLELSDLDDDSLIGACCLTLSDFIDSMNDSLILVFEPLSKYLVKYANHPYSMSNLCNSIKKIHQPPQFFQILICQLISGLPQVSPMQSIEILYCIKACFSSLTLISPFDPSIDCNSIAEVLFSAIYMHDDYRAVALGCLGNLASLSPAIVRSNIGNIMAVCKQSMENFLDPGFAAAATCIRKLTSYFPESITPFLSALVPPMLQIATMKLPNTPEMALEINIDRFQKSKCNSLRCLCLIATEIDGFGDQFAQNLWECTNAQMPLADSSISINPETNEPIESNENQESMEADKDQIAIASKIIISGAKLFSKRKFPISAFIPHLFKKLELCEDFDTLEIVLKAIKEIILFSPQEDFLKEDFCKLIGDTLIHASIGLYYNFIVQESSTIPNILHRALFGALISYSDVCRNLLAGGINEYYNEIQKYDLAEPKLKCAQFLHFLTKTFMYCNFNNDEILEKIFKKIWDTINCFQDANCIDPEILTHIFISLICMFRINKDKFASSVNGLMNYIVFLMQNYQVDNIEFKLSYQALYLNLFMLFGLPMNDVVKNILNEMKFIRNLEVIPLISDFFIFAFKSFGQEVSPIVTKFATVLFSSEKYILNLVNNETRLFYFNIINSIPQNDLIRFTNLNESALHQIFANLQMFFS